MKYLLIYFLAGHLDAAQAIHLDDSLKACNKMGAALTEKRNDNGMFMCVALKAEGTELVAAIHRATDDKPTFSLIVGQPPKRVLGPVAKIKRDNRVAKR